jgi:hypothetical protein
MSIHDYAQEAMMAEPVPTPPQVPESTSNAMFPHDDVVSQLKPMWNAIQTKFIDEPRKSVEEADALVAATVKRLIESFTSEREKLESQWARGGEVSTEDLRQALRHYRSFFDRLLSA